MIEAKRFNFSLVLMVPSKQLSICCLNGMFKLYQLSIRKFYESLKVHFCILNALLCPCVKA